VPLIAAEGGSEEGEYDLLGQHRPNDAAAQSEHIDVVVLHGLVRCVGVVNLRAANTFHFVGGDGGPGSGSTDDDSTVGAALNDGMSDGGGEVGIVDGFFGVCSQVGNRMTGGSDGGGQILFELEPGVIGGDGDAHVFAG